MSRKRDKPYPYRHTPARISKHRRPWAPPSSETDENIDKPTTKTPPPPALVVTGLPANCSVLELKSRFEMYGSISRTRIDKDGFGSVSYRTAESAKAAIAGSHEPSFGISIGCKKLQVVWATDPLVTVGEGKEKTMASLSSSSSKLLRAEMPLRKHGRSSRLASAIFNPRSNNTERDASPSPATRREFKHRDIVAYDDIL